MDGLDALDYGRAEFEPRLRAVRPGQWSADTPCDDWTVRDLVNHVVGGNRMAVSLLAGASADDARAIPGHDYLGDDPVASFMDSADDLAASFRAPGALDRICHHRVGDIPATQLLGFRATDYTLHAWDLAHTIGVDEHLDDELVEQLWQLMAPMAEFAAQSGQFGQGPSGELGDDAPLQDRLLDLSGRRPPR
jgi:uncharacterized protein (TIGR03086 family)